MWTRDGIRLLVSDLVSSIAASAASAGWQLFGTTVSLVSTSYNVAIGTVTAASKLTVAGTIESTSGGIKYPDTTTQATAGVLPTRAINTTAPVTGGGNLSADRTIAVSDFVASGGSHARGTVPTPGATAGTTRFLREDATWQEGEGYADVTVSSAELLALNATPKTLVAAPGSGFALIFKGALLFYDYGTAVYDGIAADEDLAVKYTGTTGEQLAEVEATGFLDQATNQLRWAYPHGETSSSDSAVTPVDNAPLVLHLLTGEIATGDGVLKVRTFYRRVPTTL